MPAESATSSGSQSRVESPEGGDEDLEEEDPNFNPDLPVWLQEVEVHVARASPLPPKGAAQPELSRERVTRRSTRSLAAALPRVYPSRNSSFVRRNSQPSISTTVPDREFVEKTVSIRDQLRMREKQQPRTGCVLHPDRSRFLAIWDVVTAVALCYTALLTPFEVAFLPAPTTFSDPWFLVNRLLDAIFIFDLCLQARRMT